MAVPGVVQRDVAGGTLEEAHELIWLIDEGLITRSDALPPAAGIITVSHLFRSLRWSRKFAYRSLFHCKSCRGPCTVPDRQ
ncbi:unnamed protein product [Sympodiomycopsis kandeliae]